MRKSVPIENPPNQIEDMRPSNDTLREQYRHLRRQNVSAEDALGDVAEQNGLDREHVRGIIYKKAIRNPETSGDYEAREGFQPFATSTLYRDGQVVMQWVKESRNNEKKFAEELISAMAEELPRASVKHLTKTDYRQDVIAVYPMGDPHFGMFAWGEETGEDFDLKIAEKDLCSAVARLVDTVPSCENALIINLGDFFHSDNVSGTTTKGTALDTDTRWPKVLRVGVKAIRQCIESALEKHQHVTVCNAIGNHDTHTAMFLSVALANIYENESRVTIISNPTIKHYHRFGKNLFGIHHGHTIKMRDLPFQMASDRPEDWGDTKYRFWFTGHIHHDSKTEMNGVIVESFRTLAAKDAWHTSMGYKAGRDMKAILFHRDFGEIERHVVSVEMLNK